MKRWIADLLGMGAAAAALGVGLLAGAPEASAGAGPARTTTLSTPDRDDGDPEVSLGESMQMWGRPTRLSMFHTSDTTDQVVELYTEAWKDVSALPPVVKRVDRVTSVSVLEEKTGLMRSVTVQDMGEERLVMPALVDVRMFPDLGSRSAPVPVPENAKGYSGQAADDATSISYHATYLAPMSPKTAIAFYRQELVPQGYAERPSELKSSVAEAVEFVRGPEHVEVVAANTQEADGAPATFVVVEHVRAIPQEAP